MCRMQIQPPAYPEDLFLPELVTPAEQAAVNRRKIMNLQGLMEHLRDTGRLQEMDFPLEHTFTDGAYARQMTIPAGALIIGKIHRHAHLNFVMQGRATVFTPDGLKEIIAPVMFVSTPGTKRAVLAHETTVWVTVHVTEETDLAKIEDQIIAKDFADLGLPMAAAAGAIANEGAL